MTYYHKNQKRHFFVKKRVDTAFLSKKFMITRSSLAFEDLLASSIAPQAMPPRAKVTYFSHITWSNTKFDQISSSEY